VTQPLDCSAGPIWRSVGPTISGNGRYVAFFSDASNLVVGDGNQVQDVFVRDLRTATTSRISVSTTGAEGNDSSFGPAISRNGEHIAFQSFASNLICADTNDLLDVFIRSRVSDEYLMSVDP
jgi:Tol biopolymer transport system component